MKGGGEEVGERERERAGRLLQCLLLQFVPVSSRQLGAWGRAEGEYCASLMPSGAVVLLGLVLITVCGIVPAAAAFVVLPSLALSLSRSLPLPSALATSPLVGGSAAQPAALQRRRERASYTYSKVLSILTLHSKIY